MLSLKINSFNRFLGGLLLVSLGILATLLVLTWRGSAVPQGQKTSYFNTSGVTRSEVNDALTVISGRGTYSVVAIGSGQKPSLIIPVHVYPYQWQAQPIRKGAGIAAAVTGLLALLYLGLKFLYRNRSEEIFP